MNKEHELNRARWNEMADDWRRMADERGTWRQCHRQPELVLCPEEMRFLTDIAGRQVCILGSGDNEAVFALAGMGAQVTSVDISERQLEIARERAAVLGLNIAFVRADVTELTDLPGDRFDVVYTGGHVSVWISDITKYYSEAVRILKPGGLFVVNEYHPIRRMWHDSDSATPSHGYFNRGPYTYKTEGQSEQIEFHWTVADHLQAVLDAGCRLIALDEFGEGAEEADYAAHLPPTLPMTLLIVSRKSNIHGTRLERAKNAAEP